MRMYLVEARLFSKEDTALTRIHLFFKSHSNQEPSIQMIKQKETDITAQSIVVGNLSWRTARQLEKYIDLPRVYIAPQLFKWQFRFKFIIPIKPDVQGVILGLNTWTLKRNFFPSKKNFFTSFKHQRTVAYLRTKVEAEELEKLLKPFSEETNLSVSSNGVAFLFFGVLAIASASALSSTLSVFPNISLLTFRISLIVLFPLGSFYILTVFFHFIYPPVFVFRRNISKTTRPKDTIRE